jgi:hypothetical protein
VRCFVVLLFGCVFYVYFFGTYVLLVVICNSFTGVLLDIFI